MAEEQGVTVDKDGYYVMLEESKERSRKAYAASKGGVAFSLSAAALAQLKDKGIEATDDSKKYTIHSLSFRLNKFLSISRIPHRLALSHTDSPHTLQV